MINFLENRSIKDKFIFKLLIPILLCQILNCSSANTYKIDDTQLELIKQKKSAVLEFDFNELNEIQGNPHKNEKYKVWLKINDVLYYYLWEFEVNEILRVPIPSGNVKIQIEIRNLSGLRWCKGVLNPVYINVNPQDIVKIKIKNIDTDFDSLSIGAGTAGPPGIGCLMIMPIDYYIHLYIDKKDRIQVNEK